MTELIYLNIMASSSSTDILPSIKLVSLNARGLNIPEKRSQLLQSMHKNKADIIYLQETHLKKKLNSKTL